MATISRWNPERGFGFIGDMFIHVTAIHPTQPRGVDLNGKEVKVLRSGKGDNGRPKVFEAELVSAAVPAEPERQVDSVLARISARLQAEAPRKYNVRGICNREDFPEVWKKLDEEAAACAAVATMQVRQLFAIEEGSVLSRSRELPLLPSVTVKVLDRVETTEASWDDGSAWEQRHPGSRKEIWVDVELFEGTWTEEIWMPPFGDRPHGSTAEELAVYHQSGSVLRANGTWEWLGSRTMVNADAEYMAKSFTLLRKALEGMEKGERVTGNFAPLPESWEYGVEFLNRDSEPPYNHGDQAVAIVSALPGQRPAVTILDAPGRKFRQYRKGGMKVGDREMLEATRGEFQLHEYYAGLTEGIPAEGLSGKFYVEFVIPRQGHGSWRVKVLRPANIQPGEETVDFEVYLGSNNSRDPSDLWVIARDGSILTEKLNGQKTIKLTAIPQSALVVRHQTNNYGYTYAEYWEVIRRPQQLTEAQTATARELSANARRPYFTGEGTTWDLSCVGTRMFTTPRIDRNEDIERVYKMFPLDVANLPQRRIDASTIEVDPR